MLSGFLWCWGAEGALSGQWEGAGGAAWAGLAVAPYSSRGPAP